MRRRPAIEVEFDDHIEPAIDPEHAGPGADVEHTLRQMQEVLWRFPMAARAAYSALVAEGRAYEQTPEGAELMQQLLRSPRSHRLRVIWEVLTLSSMDEGGAGAVPTMFLDRLCKTLVTERIEPTLTRLFERVRRE